MSRTSTEHRTEMPSLLSSHLALILAIACSAVATICAILYRSSGDLYGVDATIGLTAGASALACLSAWVTQTAKHSNSAAVRSLETFRSYLADEPASYDSPKN